MNNDDKKRIISIKYLVDKNNKIIAFHEQNSSSSVQVEIKVEPNDGSWIGETTIREEELSDLDKLCAKLEQGLKKG